MRLLLLLAGLALGVLAVGLVLRLLKPLPSLAGRSRSCVPDDTGETLLGRTFGPSVAAHPGLSGILPLAEARESFAARVLLVRAAERCLDVQYYIWHGDTSGRMLLGELEKAAARGVRVRLLLDDNGTSGLDRELAALDRRPNIEVRLFNPFTVRRPKLIGYAMDPLRLNRRMHNKSITADNQATIVGGRNVGDAYFGASRESLFADLDVLAVGAVVPEVSADFDRYWDSESAYPAATILPDSGAARRPPLPANAARLARAYERAVRKSLISKQMREGRPDLLWVPVRMVSDDPAKALGKARQSELLIARLLPMVGNPKSALAMVSAYFVPAKDGTAELAALARSGVKVSVLTNALNATDVAIVHAGYQKHRRALLEAGVSLFEMKGQGKAALKLSPMGSGRMLSRPVFRSSGSSLHAKTFAIDRTHLFVGSFNFDPRSALLNTELGFLIECPQLAGELHDALESGLADTAYAVRLAADGRGLEWWEKGADGADGGALVHRKEPNSGPLQRTMLRLLSLLPIDWLL